MARGRSRLKCWFLFSYAVLSIVPGVVRGDDAKAPALPPKVESVLRWFPEDTESLTVAQSFTFLPLKECEVAAEKGEGSDPSINLIFQTLAMEPLLYSSDTPKHRDALAGKKVALALRGGRNFELVSKFGSMRDEGCSVIVFEDNIDPQWLDKLRGGSQEIRKIAQRDVLVYPSTTVMVGSAKLKPWQGTFVNILDSKVLLCATSDRYLSEILNRIDTKPVKRALSDDLPEWKHADFNSPNWLLRRVPQGKRTISGLTLSVQGKGFQVVYLPIAGSTAKALEQARKRWAPPTGARSADIQLQKEGTVTVTSDINDPFIIHLFMLQGEDGRLWERDEVE